MATTSTVASEHLSDLIKQTITFTGDTSFTVDLEAGFALCDAVTIQCSTGTGLWALNAIVGSNDGSNFASLPSAVFCAPGAVAALPAADLGYRFYRLLFVVLASSSGVITVIGRRAR